MLSNLVRATACGSPSVPNLRVATFFTVQGANRSYALASLSATKQACVTYTLQLLIEPAFLQDDSPSMCWTVEGLRTDASRAALNGDPGRQPHRGLWSRI